MSTVGGTPAPEQSDLMAQVMAELGVDQPGDVMERVQWLVRRVGEQGREFVAVSAELEHAEGQRDEARAEFESLTQAAQQRDALWRTRAVELAVQRDEARAAVERLKADVKHGGGRVSAPFVGPPQLGAGCAYSSDLADPQCTNAATVHIAVDSAWGVVGLASCDEHASIARASGTPIDEHAFGPRCDGAQCWEAA